MKKVLKIALLCVLGLLIVAGVLVWMEFGALVKGAMSAEKLDDGLYYMEYRGDDGFDGLMAKGGFESADQLADICFVACCAWKLLPILDSALPLCFSKELPQWLWLWAGVIVVIKVVNQLSALVMYGRFFLDKLASCQVVKLSLSPLLA